MFVYQTIIIVYIKYIYMICIFIFKINVLNLIFVTY